MRYGHLLNDLRQSLRSDCVNAHNQKCKTHSSLVHISFHSYFKWFLAMYLLIRILTHKPPIILYNLTSALHSAVSYYLKRDDFDFDIVNFPFLDGDVPGVPHMGYTYLNLLDSPELLQIVVTLTAVIKPLVQNFLGRAIVILNFIRRFRNFIEDTVPW